MNYAEVAGRQLVISTHAVDRYVHRVKPQLTVDQAVRELKIVLVYATIVTEPPVKYTIGHAREFAVLAESITFPIVRESLVTCLTPACYNEAGRERRNTWRSNRTAARRMRNSKGRRRNLDGWGP